MSVHRDKLLFRAGQRSARRDLIIWRALAALSAGVALGLFVRPAPRPVERVVYRYLEREPGPDCPRHTPGARGQLRRYVMRLEAVATELKSLLDRVRNRREGKAIRKQPLQ